MLERRVRKGNTAMQADDAISYEERTTRGRCLQPHPPRPRSRCEQDRSMGASSDVAELQRVMTGFTFSSPRSKRAALEKRIELIMN